MTDPIPLALTYTRVSCGYRKPFLMTGGVVGYSPFGRKPLLRVEGFEPLLPKTKIRPTCGTLPRWSTAKVLGILEQQRRAVAAAFHYRKTVGGF